MAFDILYNERKRHKRALAFYQEFKALELRVSGRVVSEVGEILANSYATLVMRIRDSIKHLERTGRTWDDLNINQRRKFLIELENGINSDKELIKRNLMEFILHGFMKIETLLVNHSFDEIQDALLAIPGDLTEEALSKVESLFAGVYIDEESINKDQVEFRHKLDKDFVSNFFNKLSSSKDRDIIIELMAYLGYGTTGTTFVSIAFYTEDKGFHNDFLKMKQSQDNGETFGDSELTIFIKKTCPMLSVNIAY